MTLIVSLRIPDGIVIAGDSLSTISGNRQLISEVNAKCPSCEHDYKMQAKFGNIITTATTLSYAQKIFPFMGYNYGIGTFGLGQLMGKTIYFAIREYEAKLKKSKKKIKDVEDAADHIGNFVSELLMEQLIKENEGKTPELADNWYPIGFQVVGYKGSVATTIRIDIGKAIRKKSLEVPGITYSGQAGVVEALFGRFEKNPEERPIFEFFSLQDAITYAEFLIKTTATHQQFSFNMPGVGGEIDIALITPFDGFKWIKQKSLQVKLSGEFYDI